MSQPSGEAVVNGWSNGRIKQLFTCLLLEQNAEFTVCVSAFPEQTAGFSIAGYISTVVQSLGEASCHRFFFFLHTYICWICTNQRLYFFGGGEGRVVFKFALVSLYYKWGNGNHVCLPAVLLITHVDSNIKNKLINLLTFFFQYDFVAVVLQLANGAVLYLRVFKPV